MDVVPLNFYAQATISSNLFTKALSTSFDDRNLPFKRRNSFTNYRSSFDDRDLPFKKRLMHRAREDSSERNECTSSFATVLEEEGYHSRKLQELVLNKFTEISVYEESLYKEDEELKGKKKRLSSFRYKEDKELKEKKKRNTRKKVKHESIVRNEVTNRLERFVTDDMHGVDMKLVIQKRLYKSDLKTSQNRLNMPMNQLLTRKFLKTDEKLMLDNGKEIKVRLVGPTLEMFEETMMLKKWRQERTYNYVLRTNWNRFVAHHKDYLKEGTMIQLWSFRRSQKLCFALAIV